MTASINLDAIADQLRNETFTWNDTTINGYDVISATIATKGKNKGSIRASAPKIKHTVIRAQSYFGHMGNFCDYDLMDCLVYSAWRWMALTTGINNHSPMTEFIYRPWAMNEDKSAQKEYNSFIDRITKIAESTIDKSQWHGIRTWRNLI